MAWPRGVSVAFLPRNLELIQARVTQLVPPSSYCQAWSLVTGPTERRRGPSASSVMSKVPSQWC